MIQNCILGAGQAAVRVQHSCERLRLHNLTPILAPEGIWPLMLLTMHCDFADPSRSSETPPLWLGTASSLQARERCCPLKAAAGARGRGDCLPKSLPQDRFFWVEAEWDSELIDPCPPDKRSHMWPRWLHASDNSCQPLSTFALGQALARDLTLSCYFEIPPLNKHLVKQHLCS